MKCCISCVCVCAYKIVLHAVSPCPHVVCNPFLLCPIVTTGDEVGSQWHSSGKQKFCPDKETILNYLSMSKYFFKPTALLMIRIYQFFSGRSVYALLHSLLSPVKPQEMTFDKSKAEVKKHFEAKRSLSPSNSFPQKKPGTR